MDNIEYTSNRLERDEYRSKFRFEDETESGRKSYGKQKNKTDYLVRLMLLQCLICGLIVSGIFIASKISPSFFEKIKEDYAKIMLKDMTAGEFAQDIKTIEDVKTGMELPGIVTNITAFGAFVDIGIKQNGLIHATQMGVKGMADPSKILKLHQQVKVTVISVDLDRDRIGLRLIK